MECLKEKGLTLDEPVRHDWGTELRLNDIDGNEIVIVEVACNLGENSYM